MPSQSDILLAAITLVLISRTHATTIPFHPSSTSSLSVVAVESSASGCLDGDSCRTRWDIIWGCATTIFLCTWVSYHPDVPNPSFTKSRATAVRIISVFIAFVVPELVAAKAASDWRLTGHKSRFEGWTQTHTYFTLMGGFVGPNPGAWARERALSLDEIGKLTAETNPELLSLVVQETPKDPLQVASPKLLQPEDANPEASPPTSPYYQILVTEDAISDKGKSNFVAKSIALAQTTWFIVQFIERWAIHQPRTQLEVMTVAYAILNIVVYSLWWNKPYNVNEPMHVSGRVQDRLRSRTVGLSAWYSLLWDGFSTLLGRAPDEASFGLLLPLFGTIFGGMHCFAWQFHFSSEREVRMWRVCSVYCTASPWVAVYLGFAGSEFGGDKEDVGFGMIFVSFLVALGYVVCRIILLVVTFSCLRGAPAGVFEVTAWTRFLPHISY